MYDRIKRSELGDLYRAADPIRDRLLREALDDLEQIINQFTNFARFVQQCQDGDGTVDHDKVNEAVRFSKSIIKEWENGL